jgi:hypothetical protein
VYSKVDDNGDAVDADERTLGDGTALHRVLVAEVVVSISSPTQAHNKKDIPRNTTGDGDRRATGADGDVQAGDVDPEQGEDQALGHGRHRTRVLDVLAALSGARRRGGAGGDGSGDGGESEEGGEELHG